MSAVLSECEQYRLRLDRDIPEIPHGPVYAYFGVNPSTADATIDDQTVKKWIGFTRVFGGSRFIVGNVFAYRATDVKKLASACTDLYGPGYRDHMREIIAEADVLVPCWGSIKKVPPSLRYQFSRVKKWLRESGKPVKVFGFTKDGDPKHPMMLGYDTPLIDWTE